MHDTMNEEVRGAFDRIEWAAYPHVAYVDLSFMQLDASLDGLRERWEGSASSSWMPRAATGVAVASSLGGGASPRMRSRSAGG